MPSKWIPGQGFWLVQSTGPINNVAIKQRMELLEERLTQREQEIKGGSHEKPIYNR